VNGDPESDWRLIYADRMASVAASLLLLTIVILLDSAEVLLDSDTAMCTYTGLDL